MAATRVGVGGAVLVAVSAGLVLSWSAVKGKSPADVLRSVMTGNDPNQAPNAAAIAIPPAAVSPITAADGAATPGTLALANGRRAVVVQAARSQLGKPYVWATPVSWDNPDPASFDCSGLTGWCYNKIGVKLAHYTGTQYTQLQHVPFSQAVPGDLVFFRKLAIYHVAMWIGNNQVIEAPTTGIPVRVRTLDLSDPDLMDTVGVVPGA